MATLRASAVTVQQRAETGATVLIAHLSGATRLANLTTSGTSAIIQATGGGDWVAPSDMVVSIVVDGDVDIVAAPSPTASNAAGMPLISGVPYAVSVNAGDKIAAIDSA